ncbi:MAG: LysR family transcriptional regulator, partial [Pyramidobacter porci]|uniref:LysR family transcriptional regulator n=1 Tax=Pyramidobacter porci TaxID=2605789 RepID=UPI002A758709
MTTAQEMFLLAAQELSFSRAAKRAFVTPQCLSDHIRRLEERYGVKLFHRRPRLELTREGRTLRDYLSRIARLEENMALEMEDVSAGMRGTVRLGIPLTRGRIFIPRLMPEFQRRFPRVDVKIALRDTRDLQRMTVEASSTCSSASAPNTARCSSSRRSPQSRSTSSFPNRSFD